MRRPLLACLLALVVFTVPSCSGGDKSEKGETSSAGGHGGQAAEEVAPVLAQPELLVGGWLRRGTEFYRDGFSIEPDGELRLVGNYAREGLDWSLDGDVIILRTKIPQADQPIEERLHVGRLTKQNLMLEGDYEVAGAYTRADFIRVTGTVSATDKTELAADEGMWIRLMAPLQKGGPVNSMVAFDHVIGPTPLPASFDIIYDAEAIPAGEGAQVEADIIRASRPIYHAPRVPVAAGRDVDSVSVMAAPITHPK